MPETEIMPRCPPMQADRIRVAIATEEDRATIYRLRHSVYARELRQHPENTAGERDCSIISAAHWIGLGFLPVNSAAFAADTVAARSR